MECFKSMQVKQSFIFDNSLNGISWCTL